MKLIAYERLDSPGARRLGVLTLSGGGQTAVDLATADPSLPATMKELLAAGDPAMAKVASVATSKETISLDEIRLLAPIHDPQKVICIGLNYADHAAETGAKVGNEPVVFCKFPTAIRGPGDAIVLPPESQEVDYEAELVVVIGQPARRVSRDQAWRHIAGYACGHDVSARDWQKNKPGKQWLLGKTFDSFAPLGPWLVTSDEVVEPGELDVELRLNGQSMQKSNTRQLIFGIDYLVSYLSHVVTLLPGDLIYTGTPPGVGMARTPPVFLKAGDVVEVIIQGLGTLRNPVVAGG